MDPQAPARGHAYRLNTDTLAVSADAKANPVMIHAGEVLLVTEELTSQGKSFIEVHWGGRALKMFSVDLIERATPLQQ